LLKEEKARKGRMGVRWNREGWKKRNGKGSELGWFGEGRGCSKER
jgi:hypothetical protein